MRTSTGRTGAGPGHGAGSPSATAGIRTPSPVANIVTIEPRRAGFEDEFKVPSSFNAAACPEPPSVKIAGAAADTAALVLARVVPCATTSTCTLATPAIPYGACALIWLGPANRIGAGMPLNRTWTPPSWLDAAPLLMSIGSGCSGPMPSPINETISPGATGPGAKLAALTMLSEATGAGAVAAAVSLRIRLLPASQMYIFHAASAVRP